MLRIQEVIHSSRGISVRDMLRIGGLGAGLTLVELPQCCECGEQFNARPDFRPGQEQILYPFLSGLAPSSDTRPLTPNRMARRDSRCLQADRHEGAGRTHL